MGVSESISRFSDFYKRHGLLASLSRTWQGLKRTVHLNRMLVFYCDLAKLPAGPKSVPTTLKVERLIDYSALGKHDLEVLTSFWHPKQAHRNIKERFEKRASLWLIKWDQQIAGYCWTIQGRTIAPYYFPLGRDDVQVFDWFVFPKFRGRGVHWFLVSHILQTLASEGMSRAFGDVAAWNQASLASYKMTAFRRLGWVRSFTLFGITVVSWAGNGTLDESDRSPVRAPDVSH